jgi:hypothetical protein
MVYDRFKYKNLPRAGRCHKCHNLILSRLCAAAVPEARVRSCDREFYNTDFRIPQTISRRSASMADHPSLSVSVPFGKEAANAIQHELVVIWLSDRRLFLA